MISFSHIHPIDINYLNHKNAACMYLLRAPNKETMLVDTPTPGQYENIKKQIEKMGIKKEEVTALFLTHFHFDHASSASLFMRDFPNLTVYGHPTTLCTISEPSWYRQHLKDYIKDKYDQEVGNRVFEIPENRCCELRDNQIVKFAKSFDIQVLYTPGHSVDHICYYNKNDSVVFTGDTFGTQYKDMCRSVYPCTYMFDSYEAEKSIKKVLSCGAKIGAQSHYGYIKNLEEFGKKSSEWAKRINDIAVNSKHPYLEFYYEYVKAFGDNFMDVWNIRGHYITSRLGLKTIHDFTHGIAKPPSSPPPKYLKF